MKKIILKIIVLTFSLSFSSMGNATDVAVFDHALTTENLFSINSNTEVIDKKFEDVILNPERFLKRFSPAGVEIKKKLVSGNQFEYIVAKRILGFQKIFHLIGTITFERSDNCKNNELSYIAHIDLTPSEPIISDTIADFTLDLCGNINTKNLLTGKSRNTLYYRGNKFGIIVESIAKSLINDQVNAIYKSIKEEIEASI